MWRICVALVILLAANQCAAPRAHAATGVIPPHQFVLAIFQQMNLADTHELACALIQTADGGYYSTPVSRQREGSFRIHVPLRAGERLAAILHTHPSAGVAWDRSGEFSPEDKSVAEQLRVPSYVYFARLNQIRVFVPGVGERLINQYRK